MLYAKFELQNTSAKKSVQILNSALKLQLKDDQLCEIYKLLVQIVNKNFGLIEARPVYQDALENLNDDNAIKFGLEYAKVEQDVGEIDRARSILVYTSQMCRLDRYQDFWAHWQSFEVEFGNDETVREMLRIKNSVSIKFSNNHFGFVTSELPEDAPSNFIFK